MISYSPKGMDTSAQGCAATYLGKRSGSIRSILEGDEYAEAFVIYPLQGMGTWLYGCPRVAAGPQPWADLCIPFGERDASLCESRLSNEGQAYEREFASDGKTTSSEFPNRN